MRYTKIKYSLLFFLILAVFAGCSVNEAEVGNNPIIRKSVNDEIFVIQTTAPEILDRDIKTPVVNQPEFVPKKYDNNKVFFDDFCDAKIDNFFWNTMNREKNYNNELQAYRSENVFLCDGNLVLLAEEIDGKYYSGLVDTKSKIEFQYGIIEVRLKYREGKSYFPAIWLMPTNDTSFPEIDIFEMVGHEPRRVYSVYHYCINDEQVQKHGVTIIDNHLDFHVYKFEWKPDKMVWYIDDNEVFRVEENIPAEPMYLIMNFAIGGNWPGDPDNNTIFPAAVLIDYVKIIPFDTKDY